MTPFHTNDTNDFRLEVRNFAEKEIKPIARELDEKETFSIELSKKMGEAGLYGIDIPKEYGGRGLDTLSYIIAVEELARVDGSQAVTMAAHNSLGVSPIFCFGTEEQKKQHLPNLLNGTNLWAFGLTEENAGSDARGVDTVAKKTKDGWVLNGQKRYITNGSNSLLAGLTVLAKTGEKNGKPTYSTFLLKRETSGFTTKRTLGK